MPQLHCVAALHLSAQNAEIAMLRSLHTTPQLALRCCTVPSWTVAASRGGGHGGIRPQSEALPPTCPPVRKKRVKISHFRQIFGFLPPQNRILPPRCPPHTHKNYGAATGPEQKLRCKHGKGPFILRHNCVSLSHCTCILLHRNCDVTALRCRMKVKFILTWHAVTLRWLAQKVINKSAPLRNCGVAWTDLYCIAVLHEVKFILTRNEWRCGDLRQKVIDISAPQRNCGVVWITLCDFCAVGCSAATQRNCGEVWTDL